MELWFTRWKMNYIWNVCVFYISCLQCDLTWNLIDTGKCVGLGKFSSTHHLLVSSRHLAGVVPLCGQWSELGLQGIEVPSGCV